MWYNIAQFFGADSSWVEVDDFFIYLVLFKVLMHFVFIGFN